MANDLNSVFLVGRLTREMDLSYTQGGMAIGKMSLAVNRKTKKGDQWVDEASFFDVTLFGKTAENLKQWMNKGRQVAIRGSLRQDRWEKDGKKFSKVSIAAEDVQLLGGQADKVNSAPQSAQETSNEQGFSGEFSEDVPF